MTGSRDVNDNFDFEGIFPSCRKEYLEIEGKTSVLPNNLLNMCHNIMNNTGLCGTRQNSFNAANYCKNLGIYLNHIQSRHQGEKKRSCLFFFYKLKHMVKTYNGTCSTTVECYNIMKADRQIMGSSMSTFFTQKISDICHEYASNNNIDNNIFSKLQDLEELYDIYEKFIEHNNDGCAHDSIIKEYNQIIAKYGNENASFMKELEKIKAQCSTFIEKYNQCQTSSINAKPISADDQVISIVTSNVTSTETAPVAHAVMNVWRHTGTGVSAFTVVFLIIMLILYKFTIMGSFLQSIVRNLRKNIMKKNSVHQNSKDSFDRIYNYLNDNNYRIAYISEE
ncbi:variable surface protein [Plasmodium gonderi]|uniref:Variable surface protein n=1 Tax=Plasmodium gonderi TaxID=77519 RepID=A0A1Y1JK27_PLAGO|nr:variable surface protein [Plasmodium gonderi]GAW82018.1 variable surface protein [Plasmodium gonderi]